MKLNVKTIAVAGLALLLGSLASSQVAAQTPDSSMIRFFHYPYYYFPHNYWPSMGPRWPERPGQPYMPPPAYMSYPAFKEPHWRYEHMKPQRFYSGSHFWLDQF
ncbi:MAG: hypothetical protein EXR99_14900 [Gemmataceae bacterium]|nr:hypothetical protein [Gemmataceae bacterium]